MKIPPLALLLSLALGPTLAGTAGCSGDAATATVRTGDPAGDERTTANPTQDEDRAAMSTPRSKSDDPSADASLETATLGAGCYWCIEAVLEQIDGVKDVTSGFMGGKVENPSYEAVCAGTTGHAEVVQVRFDPKVLPYRDLLEWFWKLHDPTTLNRQGADVGTQYRSVIFTHSEEQRKAAEESKKAAGASGAFDDPIVTEITAASAFYPAKEEHQDFYRNNKRYGYCRAVIAPKLKKLDLEH